MTNHQNDSSSKTTYDNVIFLDIDGVLNNDVTGYGGHHVYEDDLFSFTHETIKWDRECVDLLREVVNETNAVIVLSSSWRINFSQAGIINMFRVYNWNNAPIVSRTPVFPKRSEGVIHDSPHHRWSSITPRCFEIKSWLNSNKVNRYVILDDMVPIEFTGFSDPNHHPDWAEMKHHYVHCSNAKMGFYQDLKDQAIEILRS